jgi:two-component system, LuxR family, sensor kinase FixL
MLAEELSLLIDGATTYAIYMLDKQGSVTIWNLGAERMLGWTEDEVIGVNFSIFYPPDDELARKPAEDLVTAKKFGKLEEESWQLRKDGSEFLASVTLTALRDASGALRGFGKVVRDITDEAAANLAVLRREQHLRSILASVPDAMIVFSENGMVSSFSKAAELMFGYASEEIIGHHIGMLVPDFRGDGPVSLGNIVVAAGLRQVVDDPTPEKGARKNGEFFPMQLAVGEALIANERIFTGFIRDLSARRRTERRVWELQSELLHMSRVSAMGTMASTLAHEINQPLTAIANYLETARAMIGGGGGPLLNEVAEALDLAAAQSLRAGTIIRRLRAFVEDGDTAFRTERLDLIVEEATSLGLLGAHEASIAVSIDVAAGRYHVRVDRIQIQQVLINLIRNAIRSMAASPTKELTIATSLDREGWMKVTVADTGSGIEPAIRRRLFEAFATTKQDGMGLGLSICRTIVEAHGGRIWSEAGTAGGSAFHFCVPLAAVNGA